MQYVRHESGSTYVQHKRQASSIGLRARLRDRGCSATGGTHPGHTDTVHIHTHTASSYERGPWTGARYTCLGTGRGHHPDPRRSLHAYMVHGTRPHSRAVSHRSANERRAAVPALKKLPPSPSADPRQPRQPGRGAGRRAARARIIKASKWELTSLRLGMRKTRRTDVHVAHDRVRNASVAAGRPTTSGGPTTTMHPRRGCRDAAAHRQPVARRAHKLLIHTETRLIFFVCWIGN